MRGFSFFVAYVVRSSTCGMFKLLGYNLISNTDTSCWFWALFTVGQSSDRPLSASGSPCLDGNKIGSNFHVRTYVRTQINQKMETTTELYWVRNVFLSVVREQIEAKSCA